MVDDKSPSYFDSMLDASAHTHCIAVFCSPFIKLHVLKPLLDSLGDEVQISIFTRWRPLELLAGVSDIKIWHEVNLRDNCSLHLIDNLHAKYYRFDETKLQGSANLTGRGLGKSNNPNLELLLPCGNSFDWREFEERLLLEGVRVNQSIYNYYDSLCKQLSASEVVADLVCDTRGLPSDWIPRTEQPSNLFLAYSKRGGARMVDFEHRKKIACEDLEMLDLPKNLELADFKRILGAQLLSSKYCQEVFSFCERPQRFGAGRMWLRNGKFLRESDDPTMIWQNTIRWLTYFLPEKVVYTRPRHSEILHCPRVQNKLL